MELSQIYTRLVSIKEDYEVAHEQASKNNKDSAQRIAIETTKRFEKIAETHPEFDRALKEIMEISKAILKLKLAGVELHEETNEEPNPYN